MHATKGDPEYLDPGRIVGGLAMVDEPAVAGMGAEDAACALDRAETLPGSGQHFMHPGNQPAGIAAIAC